MNNQSCVTNDFVKPWLHSIFKDAKVRGLWSIFFLAVLLSASALAQNQVAPKCDDLLSPSAAASDDSTASHGPVSASICVRPSGVATRETAYEQMGATRQFIESRLAPNQPYVLMARVPPDVGTIKFYKQIERDEARKQFEADLTSNSVPPDTLKIIRQLQQSLLNSQGKSLSESDIFIMLYDRSDSKKSDISDNGFLYFYSNHNTLSKDIAGDLDSPKGFVLESEDINASILSPDNYDRAREFFWGKIEQANVPLVVTVGLDLPDNFTADAPNKQVLRISNWDEATGDSSHLEDLMDVPPSRGAVVNLLPTSAKQIEPWKFPEEIGGHYVHNGKAFQTELENFGYHVSNPNGSTPQEVLQVIRDTVTGGKKVLIIAETSTLPGEKYLVRIPGLPDGLTPADFNSLGPDLLKNVLLFSCNSQVMSPDLPLSVAGTIYSDKVRQLIRRTFTAGEADTVPEYLQMGRHATKSLTAALARFAESRAKQTSAPEASPEQEGFVKRATIYTLSYVPPSPPVGPSSTTNSTPVASSLPPPAPAAGTQAAAIVLPVSQAQSGIAWGFGISWLFGIGFFGALLREGFRWKTLLEKNKYRRYCRPPYLALSCGLLIGSGGAAAIFANVVPWDNWRLIVAFVGGAGADKIVQLAARLKIWNPLKSVPFGQKSLTSAENTGQATIPSQAEESASVLEFLRH